MKKITLFLFSAVLLAFSWQGNAQCISGTHYGTYAAVNDWNVQEMATCNYTTEYSIISGLIIDDTYEIGLTDNSDDANNYVTVTDATNTVIDHGATPFTWTATATDVRFHWSDDAGCATTASCHTSTLYNTSITPPSCDVPTGLSASPLEFSANLSWNAPSVSTPTGYNWEVQPVGIAQGTAGAPASGATVAPEVTAMASGLESMTSYDLYVQTDCDTDGTSAWVGPINFTTTGPPPANDECDNAISLTVESDLSCGELTAGTTVDASASAQADDVTGTPNNDVWFTFVATSESHQITLLNKVAVTGFSTDLGMGLYDGTGGCNGLMLVVDSDPDNLTATGLVVGTTYYLRVYGWGSGTGTAQVNFDVCVGTLPEGPENDECDNPFALTVNSDLTCGEVTSGTNVSATASSQADDVTGNPNNDVWYSFEATSTVHQIDLQNVIAVIGTSTDMGMGLYDSTGGCNALAFVDDSDPNSMTVGGLTVGVVYYLRVYGWGTTNSAQTSFDICVGTPPAPPANDNCATASSLVVNAPGDCTETASGTLVSSTESAINPSCDTSTEYDVWYRFSAPDSGALDFTVTLDTGNPLEYAIFDDCEGTTQLFCSDPLNGAVVTGLTAGNTYYLMVWNDSFETPGDFTICASEISCGAPSTLGASVETADTAELSWTMGGTESMWDVEVVDITAGGSVTGTPTATGVTNPYTVMGLTEGNDYEFYVRADCGTGVSSWSGPYSWSQVLPPANDDITNAIMLTVDAAYCDGTNTNGTNVAATDSMEANGSCFNGTAPTDDVWFSFTVPAGVATVDVSTDFTGGTLIDSEIALYSGTSGSLVEIECSQDDGVTNLSNGFSWNSLILDAAVNEGETYYVQVAGYGSGSNQGTFCLEISTNTLGTSDFEQNSFKYFPNPVNDKLSLRAQSNIQNVSVFNMLGQEVMRVAPNSISSEVDMTALNAGAYFVKVTINDNTETIKVIRN